MAKGQKTGGRTIGTPNKTTASQREAINEVYGYLQAGDKANLKKWAEENPSEFYKHIWIKLLPSEVSAVVDTTYRIIDETE